MKWVVVIAVILCGTGRARADGEHTAYVELFGKAGLWGVGYDYRLRERWTAGAAVSATRVDGETVLAASPYLGFSPLTRGRHGLFAQVGPQLVHRRVASPVPEWDGDASTGVGGQLSSGYEYRGAVVVRAYLTVTFGRGGVEPWGGITLGYRF